MTFMYPKRDAHTICSNVILNEQILNLNLNGLLVTRQIDNTSPGGGGVPGGKLVPGSHKRCELGHSVIRHFSRGDQRIREVIPVPDSLWKETTFVRFFAS